MTIEIGPNLTQALQVFGAVLALAVLVVFWFLWRIF